MSPPTPSSHRRITTALTAVGLVGALAAPSAAGQTAPAPPETTPPAAPTDPSATTAPTDPAAPTTTAKPAAPAKPPPGRRALSKDPEVLAADGRNPAGVIVATSPTLDVVPVTSERYDGAAQQRDADAADLADANHRIARSEARLAELEVERQALVGLIARTDRRRHKLGLAAGELRDAVRSMAITRFVDGSSDSLYPDPNETLEDEMERSHRATIAGQAEQTVEEHADTVERRLAVAESSLDEWTERQGENESETATTTGELTRARSDAEIATAAIVGAEEELRSARPMTVVAGSDLPFVALDAYWRAANELAVTRSACGIQWWALAGVGRSESNHGRSSGGQAGPDGTVSVPVFGIPLDGTGGTRLIPDSDKGALDLDPVLDRAIGVMQFLPGTWKRWAEDESGDKVSDPQNIYDAALASGKLLCSSASDLDGDEGLRKAYFAYNRSEAYVEKVLGYARGYQQLPIPAEPADETADGTAD